MNVLDRIGEMETKSLPELRALYKELKTIFEPNSNTNIQPEIKHTVEEEVKILLVSMGIYGNIKGYTYIAEIVSTIYDANTVTGIMDVYKKVAQNHQTNYQAVDRACMHTIKKLWNSNNELEIKKIFGRYVSVSVNPANRDFIFCIMEYVRKRRRAKFMITGK